MNTLVILGFQISLGLIEIIIFQLGAVILGISIHFFVTSRKSMKSAQKSALPVESDITEADEWRLRYYEQVDLQKKLEQETRRELEQKQEQENLLNRKLEAFKSDLEIQQDHEYYLSKKVEEKQKELEEKQEREHILIKKLEEIQAELEGKRERELILNKKLEETQNELAALKEAPVQNVEREVQAGEYLAQLATAQMNFLDHNQKITRLLEQIELLLNKNSEFKSQE